MRAFTLLISVLSFQTCCNVGVSAAEPPTYLLDPQLDTDLTTTVSIDLEMGGQLLVKQEGKTEMQPVSVAAKLVYHERLVEWAPEAKAVARSVRKYEEASATIKVEDRGAQDTLPKDRRTLAVEIRDGYVAIDSLTTPLTRTQFDLVNVDGNTLGLDRLLPGREVAGGENWQHEKSAIAPLLDMDHVAVCEVSSVVTGAVNNQVQIRLAGTVHGTIDGAPTEIELRGAYLYHLEQQRITKFNLAIKEKRTPSEVVPGLDIVAQIKLTIIPAANENHLAEELVAQVRDMSHPLRRALLYEASQRGFRFLHDTSWYIMDEKSDVLSLSFLQEGNRTGHCKLSTLAPRSPGRETTLEEFERDVRDSIWRCSGTSNR